MIPNPMLQAELYVVAGLMLALGFSWVVIAWVYL
jgi:hypothetical protein